MFRLRAWHRTHYSEEEKTLSSAITSVSVNDAKIAGDGIVVRAGRPDSVAAPLRGTPAQVQCSS